MKFYVSGAMRGVPQFNFPAFDSVTKQLRQCGHDVVNPAEHDRKVDPHIETRPGFEDGTAETIVPLSKLLAWDIRQITRCDAIVVVTTSGDWKKSAGVGVELQVARELGLRVFYASSSKYGTYGWDILEEVEPTIIGLAGYAQSGKDTVAAHLVAAHGFEQRAFADKLKAVLYDTDPVLDHIYQLAVQVDLYGWETVKKERDAVRPYLQRLGASVRDHLGESTWVDAALADLPGRLVISDVRYPNEAEAIKKLGGEVWRISRTGHGPANDHISESAMDDWEYDRHISNYHTIEWLHSVVDQKLAAATKVGRQ